MLMQDQQPVPTQLERVPRRGRAAGFNTANPFEPLHFEEDPSAMDPEDLRQVKTTFFSDNSQSILSRNSSPDIGFDYSINPYRGCEHGCIYCYARPTHEYLGFSAGIDFESKILVKSNAPQLLSKAFESKTWIPQPVCLSGNTDPYQPIERKLMITRQCLEVFLKYQNPVLIISKNHLILRDLDILARLAEKNLVSVTISITSLDNKLIGEMEPRTSRPDVRLKAIETLSAAGIPVGVNVAPLIPGLTDEELPEILERSAAAGARNANYLVVRLPGPVEELFLEWLYRCRPLRAARVHKRITELRDGAMSDSRFGSRHRGQGLWADMLRDLFNLELKKNNLSRKPAGLRTDLFRSPSHNQTSLFD